MKRPRSSHTELLTVVSLGKGGRIGERNEKIDIFRFREYFWEYH